MKKIVVVLIAWGLLLSGAAAVNALTLGGYWDAGYYAEFGPADTDWIANLTLKQFDSSLGTLTKIELFLSGSETSTATVTPPSGQDASWRALSVNTDITLFNPSDNTTELLLITPGVSTGVGSVNAGETYHLDGSGSANDNTALFSGDTGFSMFIGNGLISLFTTAESWGSADRLSSGGVFTPTGTASEHLYVVYTYDESSPVPEPATMLLFGTGLAGLAALSRRKKA